MADEMTRAEFTEYMHAFEQRLAARFGEVDKHFAEVDRRFGEVDKHFAEVDRRFGEVDTHFVEIDRRFGEVHMQFAEVHLHFGKVESRVTKVEAHLDQLPESFKRIDRRFDQLEHSMKMQFEETRGQIRFSLEAVVALRETSEQGFADLRGRVEEQTTLLKAAVTHVRGRVERLERRRG